MSFKKTFQLKIKNMRNLIPWFPNQDCSHHLGVRDGFSFLFDKKGDSYSLIKFIKFKSTFCYKNEINASFQNKLIYYYVIKQKRFSWIKLLYAILVDSC